MASVKKEGTRVALVTGSNKGLGKAIVRGLCKQFDGDVYLTARDAKNGEQAVEDLKKEGLNPCFHQLDINDPKSIDRLRLHLEQNYGGLDVLVNNAGMAFSMASKASAAEQAEVTNKTNFWGTLNMCKTLFPILKSHARVVHVSSLGGALALSKSSPSAIDRIKSLKSVAEVEKLVCEFVEAAKSGNIREKTGLSESSYGISKMALNVAVPMQQKMFDQDKSKTDIIVNACCPGFVKTELSSHTGVTPDEGADTPIYLALLPPGNESNPRGSFLSKRQVRSIEATEEEIKFMDTALAKSSQGH